MTGFALGSSGVLSVQKGVVPGATAAPFAAAATLTDLSLRPDFLVTADLNGDGHLDLVTASRGGSTFLVLLGDGQGGFTPQPALAAGGAISALTTWQNPASGERLIALGSCANSCAVVLEHLDGTVAGRVPVAGTPSILEAARLNGRGDDLVAGGPAGLAVLDARSLLSTSPRVDELPIAGAVAATTGSFVYDRRFLPQVAVLTEDGSIHTLARAGVQSTPPGPGDFHVPAQGKGKGTRSSSPHGDPALLVWVDAEQLPAAVTFAADARPLLVRARISGSGGDDLVAFGGSLGRWTIVRHPVVPTGGAAGQSVASLDVLPAQIETEPGTGATVAAALPMRVSSDARQGLVIADSTAQPAVAQQTAYKTYTVGTTADHAANASNCSPNTGNSGAASCSLRDAVAAAMADYTHNESAGTADTVYVPEGTYTLSYSYGLDDQGAATYHLEIYGPINLIGISGSVTTIINAASKDKVISINSGFNTQSIPLTSFDAYISGFTLENGKNPNSNLSNPDAGLLDFETDGNGNLTMSGMVLTAGVSPYSSGGAVYLSDNIYGNNSGPGNGTFELDNSTVSSSQTPELGGAVSDVSNANGDVPVILNGDIFSGNTASLSLNTSDDPTFGSGSGGGVYLDNYTEDSGYVTLKEQTIANCTFSGNSGIYDSTNKLAQGGGLYSANGLSVTTSVFTGNKVTGSTSEAFGGGLWVGSYLYPTTITGSKFTTNSSSGYGGGLFVSTVANAESGTGASDAYATVIQFDLISGNVAATGEWTGLGIGNTTGVNKPVTATEDFWGCNKGANGTGCDTAGLMTSPAQTGANLLLTPYVIFSGTLNTTTPAPGTNLVLTAGLTKDSAGNILSGTSELNAFSSLGTTYTVTQNSSQVASGTATTSTGAVIQPSYTPTASGSGTFAASYNANASVSIGFAVTVASPTIAAAFNPASVGLNGTSTLTFTLTNPNTNVSATGVAFSDSLPAGLVVASTPAVSNTCGGSVTTTAGGSTIALNGGTVNAQGTCRVAVNVTATTSGNKSDTTGAITSSNETSSGAPSNTAVLMVKATPSLVLVAPATADRGKSTTLNATLTIPSGSPAPTAQVSFYAGSTLLGSQTLTGSGTTYTAAFTTSQLPADQQSLTVQYPGDTAYNSVTSAAQGTYVIANNLWIANGNRTTTVYQATGTPFLASPETSGGTGVAIDSSGNVWSLNSSANSLAEFTSTGSVVSSGYTGGGLSTPLSLAIDGGGQVWITNNSNSISVFNSSGSAVSATAYTGGSSASPTSLNKPTGVAIDASGNLWIANSGGNSVTEVIGAAAPTVSPIAAGVANNTLAARP